MESAWKDVCKAEKNYLNYKANLHCQMQHKNELHKIFKESQKIYDRKFRYFKRKHRKQGFTDLEHLSRTNPAEMWARLNKLSNPPTTRAALQIVRDDGSISSDVKEVLERWHRDISNLFSGIRQNPEFAFDDSFYEQIIKKKEEFENLPQDYQDESQAYPSSKLNEEISYDEVSSAIDRAKSRKSYLQIPNEALKNQNAK